MASALIAPLKRLHDRLAAWWRVPGRRHKWGGAACSAILHATAGLLLAFVLPQLASPEPDEPEPIAVELMPGDLGPASGTPETAKQPEERAPDAPEAETKPPEPVPQTAPANKKLPEHQAVVRPRRKPRHPQPTPPALQPRNGSDQATLSPAPGLGGAGQQGTFSVKDFLRAQVERHWNFDLATLGAGDVVVSIHIDLEPDGSVRSADIVPDPRYENDPAYQSIADSARRAVLVSSPLQLPPGTYDAFHDVTLSFDAREAVR